MKCLRLVLERCPQGHEKWEDEKYSSAILVEFWEVLYQVFSIGTRQFCSNQFKLVDVLLPRGAMLMRLED